LFSFSGGQLSMCSDVHRDYLQDLGFLVKDNALEARRKQKEAEGTSAADFANGYSLAWYEIVSLLQGQAVAFQLPLEDLGLERFNPDRELL
jgi:hypothetical protein